jgi:hypothetical protein
LVAALALPWLWLIEPAPSASPVRVVYPELAGAPALTAVRVQWGTDKLAWETLHPGDDFGSFMQYQRTTAEARGV